MKNWSLSKKLFLLNTFYLLPCSVLVFFLIQDRNNKTEFSRKERYGLEYQQPLQNLLGQLSQYKVIALRHLAGDMSVGSKMELIRSQVEQDFAQIEGIDPKIHDSLEVNQPGLASRKRESALPQTIRGEWKNLTDQQAKLDKQGLNTAVNKLIASVRLAINHVGDTSNLILDPDLDTYYLMDITLLAMPQIQDRLQEALTYVQMLSSEVVLTDEQVIQIRLYSSLLEFDIMRIASSVQTAILEDKNFYGPHAPLQKDMAGHLKDFLNANDKFINALKDVAKAKRVDGDFEKLLESGDQVIDSSYHFWSKCATSLDEMLLKRMRSNDMSHIIALVLALLAWLPPVLITVFSVRNISRNLTNSVAKLESEAHTANSSSYHLASASQIVSSGSTEQAAAIQETGASMSEVASMISRSSAQAINSQELAKKVKEQTDEGSRVMEKMVHSMESVQESNGQLQNISNIINDISIRTNVINDIVGKTQLLSFNASIEAARAGQHGKGFAVVAEEVGNLAQSSGNAAKEIRKLIDDSRQQVNEILTNNLERVGEGKSVTEEAHKIFEKIAKDISLISEQIESISEAAREQQFGIEQIAKAMAQMDQSTQANNTAAVTAARLSDQLMNQSQKLTFIAKSVADFVSGKSSSSTTKKENGGGGPSNSVTSISEKLISKEGDMDLSRTQAISSTVTADDESFQKVI